MQEDRQGIYGSIFKKAVTRRKSEGFTLIELVISISIIVIMLAVSVPAINSYMSRHAPQYATDELYGDIQLAKMRAARNNQRCRILFSPPPGSQYTIQDVGNNGNIIGTFKVGNFGKFRDNITFCLSPDAADPAPYATLEFLSQGIVDLNVTLPVGSNAVYLTNAANDTIYRVLVSIAGGVDIDRWDPTANQWR